MAKIAVHLPNQVPQSWVDALVEGLPQHERYRWPNVVGGGLSTALARSFRMARAITLKSW